jgi:glycopeptide antibiotics resistance protein
MVVNLLGNLALTAPLGIIGPWLWGQARCGNVLGVLLCGFVVSVAIEATQYACEHRMADVDDVLLNTIGAVMGYGAIQGFETVRRLGTKGLWSLMMGTTERGGMGGRTTRIGKTVMVDHPD